MDPIARKEKCRGSGDSRDAGDTGWWAWMTTLFAGSHDPKAQDGGSGGDVPHSNSSSDSGSEGGDGGGGDGGGGGGD